MLELREEAGAAMDQSTKALGIWLKCRAQSVSLGGAQDALL